AQEIYCGIETPVGDNWTQDPDTLDTWFSSGLWTFSTLGWGSDDAQWQREKIYHPTTVLETGYDILFFWVARMILMSKYFLDEVPFKNVYLHGLVRDEQGRKMSKSLGNVLDPLDIIPEYGADALRLALVLGSTPGNDIKIGTEKIKSSRNFTNKLWNIGRYVLTQSKNIETPEIIHTSDRTLSLTDHWILDRLHNTVSLTTNLLEQYNFSLAGEILRDFTWNNFADWYIEIHKIEKNDTVLRFVFETLLKLWHPFMPFVTEALFQSMHPDEKKLLMVESWPNLKNITADLEQKNSFEKIIEIVTKIRNIRSVYHIEPVRKVDVTILTSETDLLESQRAIIQKLARIETLTFSQEDISPKNSAHISIANMKIFVHLEGVLDIETETARLTKEKTEIEQYISRLNAKLANKNFVDQAPENVVAGVRVELTHSQQKLSQIIEALDSLA
ncbi:MAG: class I tRNA ligase family protein, partial [Candidatus Moraniibacteriota bacterium]